MFCQTTKGFLKYANSKRRPKRSLRPIFDDDGHQKSGDEEKTEAFSASALPQSSVCIVDLGLPGPMSLQEP